MPRVSLVPLLLGVAAALFATHSPYLPVPDWPRDCATPERVYLLSRHGIRQPPSKMLLQLARLPRRLLASRLSWLRSWRSPFARADDLAARGVRELRAAGGRLAHRLGGPLGQADYDARSTHVRRAARSGIAFCQGLEADDAAVPFVSMEPRRGDGLLRPFQTCAPFVAALKNASQLQHEAFAAKLFPGIAARLRAQTGVAGLGPADVPLFWETCAYESSLFNVSTSFCSLFNESEHHAMAFWVDLATYYRRGYGNPESVHLSRALGREMAAFLTTPSKKRALLRFAHAETVMPLLVFLGLFRDASPLLASDAEGVWRHRQWSTTLVCPFQANVAVYVAQCGRGERQAIVQVNERTALREDLSAFARRARGAGEDVCAHRSAAREAGFCV